MSTIPLSEAKARLSEIADEVGRTHERVHITRNGREYVVLLADTRAQERIAAAEADITAGEVLDEQQVRALMDTRALTQP